MAIGAHCDSWAHFNQRGYIANRDMWDFRENVNGGGGGGGGGKEKSYLRGAPIARTSGKCLMVEAASREGKCKMRFVDSILLVFWKVRRRNCYLEMEMSI